MPSFLMLIMLLAVSILSVSETTAAINAIATSVRNLYRSGVNDTTITT